MPPTKLSILKKHMAAGKWREALRLAAKFPQLGDQKTPITRAWAAIINPKFYRQIGEDPEALYRAGVAALKSRYL